MNISLNRQLYHLYFQYHEIKEKSWIEFFEFWMTSRFETLDDSIEISESISKKYIAMGGKFADVNILLQDETKEIPLIKKKRNAPTILSSSLIKKKI